MIHDSRFLRWVGRAAPRAPLGLAVVLLLCGSASAADYRTTLTITVTNVAGIPTNGTGTLTVDSDTRTATNIVASNPGKLWLGTNVHLRAVTNLFTHLALYPFGSGVSRLGAPRWGATNVIRLDSQINQSISASVAGNWGTVLVTTNYTTNTTPVTVPANTWTEQQQTNIGDGLVAFLDRASQAIANTAIGLSNYVALTTHQILANKVMTSSTNRGGALENIEHSSGTNANWTNVVLVVVDLSRVQSLSGYLTALTNGALWSNIINQATLSNSTFVGTTTFAGASLALEGQGINNLISLTSTSTIAAANSAIAFMRARGTNMPLLNTAMGALTFNGWLGASYGAGASIQGKASQDWSATSGPAAIFFSTTPSNATTRVVRLTIGDEGTVTVSSDLVVAGTNYSSTVIVTNLVALGGSFSNFLFQTLVGTNFQGRDVTLTGTNTINGDLAYGRFLNSSMINGNNSGILIGTNVIVELSGATTIAQYAGFLASRDGDTRMIRFDGPVTNILVDANDAVWSPDGVAANRIKTGTGGAIVMTNKPSWAEITYRAASSWWEVQRHSR